MYDSLKDLHNISGVITLLLVIITTVYFGLAYFSKREWSSGSKTIALVALIFTHLQLLFGLILYSASPIVKMALDDMAAAMKNPDLRFWAVEHFSTMLIAVVFVTLGYSLSKRAKSSNLRYKRGFTFFLLGMVAMLLRFPWDRVF